MLAHFDFDLTVVMTTCDRPELFKQCLDIVNGRHKLPIRVQAIVVDESDEKIPMDWLKSIDLVIRKDKQGMWGSYAKDAGLKQASGEFVCFWDDDNIYYPDALLTLFRAADNHDIGVVQAILNAEHHGLMPPQWTGAFIDKQIDTMCLCVRTSIARNHLWVDDCDARNTEFRWISRVSGDTDDFHFVAKKIGKLVPWSVHLDRMGE